MGYWRVREVVETEGMVKATLGRVEWFKKNPDLDPDKVYVPDEEIPEEFIDATPGDVGAEFIDSFGTMTIEVTEGPEMHAGDDVEVSFTVMTWAEADA